MTHYLRSWLILFCLLWPGAALAKAEPRAVAGAIDLSNWDAERDGPRELSGEWRLFRDRLLGPAGVADDPDDVLIKVPGGWNDVSRAGEPLPPRANGLGAGTYHLRIKLPPGQARLGLLIEPPRYAYRVLWNGTVIARVGRVAADDLGDQAQRAVTVVELPQATGDDELIIQLANHLHFEGGMVGRVRIGAFEELKAARYRDLYLVTLVLGGLAVMGIYHLILFLAPRGGAESGFIAYTSLAVIIRLWGIPALPAEIWPNIGYAFFLRLEYATSYILPAAGLSLLRCLLPRDVPPLLEKSLWVAGLIGTLVSIVAPGPIFTYSRLVLSTLTIFTAIVAFCVTFVAIKRRRDYAVIILICFTPFVAAGMAESFYFFFIGGAVPPIQAVPLGFLFCGIGFATVIGLKQRDALEAKEQFSRDLERLAATLEMKVSDRTAHLEQALREVEAARAQADEAYQSLASTQSSLVQSEKLASLGGLVAGIAHEINTPVGVAVTAGTHIEERLGDVAGKVGAGKLTRSDLDGFLEEARSGIRLLLTNIERAAELVSSFKLVSADRTSEIRRRYDLKTYVTDVVQSLMPQVRRGGHVVRIDGPDGIIIDGPPGALAHVVTNLVMNAVVHGFGDRREGKINVTLAADAGFAHVSVSDNGAGIPPHLQPRIFDPFVTTKRGRGGTGLGLHIVHNTVTHVLGGTIEVVSEMGSGTRFHVTFPVMAPNDRPEGDQPW